MKEFLHMGGYAGYVWSAYGLALAVLLLNVIAARRRNLRARREVRQSADDDR